MAKSNYSKSHHVSSINLNELIFLIRRQVNFKKKRETRQIYLAGLYYSDVAFSWLYKFFFTVVKSSFRWPLIPRDNVFPPLSTCHVTTTRLSRLISVNGSEFSVFFRVASTKTRSKATNKRERSSTCHVYNQPRGNRPKPRGYYLRIRLCTRLYISA